MKSRLLVAAGVLAAVLSVVAFAQAQREDHQHHSGGAPTQAQNQSPATKAYMEAAERMHGPMMEGMQASDPDVAFVKGMIPHHEGAIDMAKVVLKYGKDEQTMKWASDIVREQQREISEMRDWLKKRAR